MILLSPDAVLDVERVRGFLEERNPEAAKRALAAIWRAPEQAQAFPESEP
jgi:toxin ParE1/3/4